MILGYALWMATFEPEALLGGVVYVECIFHHG